VKCLVPLRDALLHTGTIRAAHPILSHMKTWSLSSTAAGREPPGKVSAAGVLRREGEYWTVGYCGRIFRLKDYRGLAYLVVLLRHPGTEFHVLDLAGGSPENAYSRDGSTSTLPSNAVELEAAGIHVGRLGDAGEMLDEQAKAAYRVRLVELREELDEAKELGRVDRAAKVEDEIEALAAELSRAVGLAGRNRRAASATERARQRAKKSITIAIQRIAKNDSALGGVLAKCIRTGIHCSYIPDTNLPIEWQFAEAPNSEAATQVTAPPFGIDPSLDLNTSMEFLGPLLDAREESGFEGREVEMSHLRELIEGALAGHGAIVLVGGGPGVGKTRLAIEAGSYALRRSCGFLIGRCYERVEPRPYLPFEEIIEMGLREARTTDAFRSVIGENFAELAQIAPRLRRVYPNFPARMELPPEETRRYLFQSVAESFAHVAHHVPLVLLLDDLHWADETSLQLLFHLAHRITQIPIVIVATYRDTDLERNATLVRTLEELHRSGISTIKLHDLSEEEVARMLRGLSLHDPPQNVVKTIYDETQGNPFFVKELYRHLVEEGKIFDASGQFQSEVRIDELDVPDKVHLVVGRRLERLGEGTKSVLIAAAVMGRSFSFKLLETLLDQANADDLLNAIERAQQMGLVVSGSEGPEALVWFTHEIVRQTLLAGISLARRQRLHLRVAEALEKVRAKTLNEHAEEIAHHLVQAGSASDLQRTAHYLSLAGSAALDRAAYETALGNFQSAYSRIDENDARQRADLLYKMAIAERGLGRWDDALVWWNESRRIYIAIGDREAAGRISFRIAQGFVWAGRYEDAANVAGRGLAQLEGAVTRDRALLLATLGMCKAVEGNYRAADEAFSEAFALVEDLSDRSLKSAILSFRLEFDFLFLRLHRALEESREAEFMHPESSLWVRARQLCWTQYTLYDLGRLDEATAIGKELEPLATKIGHVAALSFCVRIGAWTEFAREPDLSRLAKQLEADLDANRTAGLDIFAAYSHGQLSVLEFLRGDWDEALSHAEKACTVQTPNVMVGTNLGILLRQKAYAGDRDGALAVLNEHHKNLPVAGQPNNIGSWTMLLLAVEGLFVLGEVQRAGDLYPIVRELLRTETICVASVALFPQTIAGVAAAAARQWELSEEHFRIAWRQAEQFPHRLEQAEIRRFYASMLLGRGAPNDRKTARQLLIEAEKIYTRIGMPRHTGITNDLLKGEEAEKVLTHVSRNGELRHLDP
jgi:tetratricopeptide (TPR) repeat protein